MMINLKKFLNTLFEKNKRIVQELQRATQNMMKISENR